MKLKPAGIDSDTGYWQACEHGNAYFGCTKLRSFFSYCASNQNLMQLVEAEQHNTEGCGFDFRGGSLGFFLLIPSGRTMAVRSTQPLTEMRARNVSWG
jgi:hypothetical protein